MRRSDSLLSVSPRFVAFAWRYHRCVLFAPSGRDVRPWAPGSCYSGSRAGNCRWKRQGLSGSRATLVSLRPVL